MGNSIYSLKTSIYFSGLKREINADKEIRNIKQSDFSCFNFFLRHNESDALRAKAPDLDIGFIEKIERKLLDDNNSGTLQTTYHILGFLKFFQGTDLEKEAINILNKYRNKIANKNEYYVLNFSATNSLIQLDKGNRESLIPEITKYVAENDELKEFIVYYLNFYYGGLSESIERINKFGDETDHKLELFHLLYPILGSINPKLLSKLSINIEQVIQSAENIGGDVQKVYSTLVL